MTFKLRAPTAIERAQCSDVVRVVEYEDGSTEMIARGAFGYGEAPPPKPKPPEPEPELTPEPKPAPKGDIYDDPPWDMPWLKK